MKKITLLLLVLLTAGVVKSYAQTSVNTDECLLKEFKQSELDEMSADELAYQRFYVENAVQVYPIPEDKPKDIYPSKKWVVNSDVCIFDLKVKVKAEERVNFFSKNGNLVMIYSEKELKHNYEKNK